MQNKSLSPKLLICELCYYIGAKISFCWKEQMFSEPFLILDYRAFLLSNLVQPIKSFPTFILKFKNLLITCGVFYLDSMEKQTHWKHVIKRHGHRAHCRFVVVNKLCALQKFIRWLAVVLHQILSLCHCQG